MKQKTRVRKKIIRSDRRLEIVNLYSKGWTQQQIADKYGIQQPNVSLEIKSAVEEWRKEMVEAIDSMKGKEVHRILALERTYWEEFDKSRIRKVYPKKKDGSPDYSKKPKEVEVLGDPQLLAGIRGCIELRCKVMGLFKETNTTNVAVFSMERLVDEIKRGKEERERDRLAEVERIQLELKGQGTVNRSSQEVGGTVGNGVNGAHQGEEGE